MGTPWMPLYVADYLKDTRHLTTMQHGAYLLLIMEYWTKGKLPEQDRQLARVTCMSTAEWKTTKSVVQPFFQEGWVHRRLDRELVKATSKHSKRQKAGSLGGLERARRYQKPSNATASSSQPHKDSDAYASGAAAPSDPRTRLFRDGLAMLANITGKGPDACRAFLGKCLKAASDDAIVVLGLIEDAARNQVANPSAWIAARLKPQENAHGKAQGGSLLAALDRALEQSQDADPAEAADLVLSVSKRSV